MAVWTLLLGVRKDLRLRRKWWHHAAVGFSLLSSLIVYLTTGAIVAGLPIQVDRDTAFSLSLLNRAAGRQQTTTIADLDALTGVVAHFDDNGKYTILPRNATDTVRCESAGTYKSGEKAIIGGVTYRAIPDYKDQPEKELRHCIAAPLYAQYTASSIAIFVADGTSRRKQVVRGTVVGIASTLVWLFLFWNFYYRGFVPIYAKRRELRRRRRVEQYGLR